MGTTVDRNGREVADGVTVRLFVGRPPRLREGVVEFLDPFSGTLIVRDASGVGWGATVADVLVKPKD